MKKPSRSNAATSCGSSAVASRARRAAARRAAVRTRQRCSPFSLSVGLPIRGFFRNDFEDPRISAANNGVFRIVPSDMATPSQRWWCRRLRRRLRLFNCKSRHKPAADAHPSNGPVTRSAQSAMRRDMTDTADRSRRTIDVAAYADRILSGDRAILARAITLVESRKAEHRAAAQLLLQRLLPHTGKALRVGITGVPGVGKSTVIDTLGSKLTGAGHKIAVLAVDQSSTRTGGSILGDKTRMARLAVDQRAFIRPSPSSGTLGGVAAKTRETMLLCEAAGHDVVIVETVGIGQSETT